MRDDTSDDGVHNSALTDSRQAYKAFGDAAKRSLSDLEGVSGILFEQAMAQTRMAICLSDPNAADEPLVFVNRAFTELTGYQEEEIIGLNCRFLQGPNTNPDTVEAIRAALEAEDVIVAEILNYRKDGTPFWNALHLGPIYNEAGKLIYYFGSQWDVTNVHAARAEEANAKAISRELSHRMKNMFAVISGVVSVTGRAYGAGLVTEAINDRIQALGRAYEPTLDDAASGTIEIGQAIRAVLSPYDESRIHYAGSPLRTEANIVSTVGLALHELSANAIKYGSLSQADGQVAVAWAAEARESGHGYNLVIRWVESGGPQIDGPPKAKSDGRSGTGLGIIEMLLAAVEGRLDREWEASGLRAAIVIPLRRVNPTEEIADRGNADPITHAYDKSP